MVVLIVDDSTAIRRIERDVLARLGDLEVLEAEDGVDAIRQMKSRDFQIDLILVDWVMPRMDGLTFVRLIKSTPNLSKIPILMVTSCSDERMMGEAWKTGVDGYLLKPFTREIFLRAILSLPSEEGPSLAADVIVDSHAEEKTFLDDVPADERRRVLDMSIIVDYEPDETVLRENEAVEYFYYVVEGEVEERQLVSGCSGALVRRYGPGECFGVTELMSGDCVSSAFLAARWSRIGRLPRAAFEGMLLKYPEIGIALSRILASKARQLEVQADRDGTELSGALEVLDLPALMQAISLRQKTCIIELPDLRSEICFVCGQIVAARHRDLEGKEAFFRIMEEQPRNFRLASKSVDRDRNIHESTTRLLLECARRIDEQVV